MFNKLYVKIFLWFWLTLAATVASLAALSSVSFSEISYEPLREQDARQLHRLGRGLEVSAKKYGATAQQVINRSRIKGRKKIYLYSPEKDIAYSNFTAIDEDDLSLLNFRLDMPPQIIFHEHFHAIGPLVLDLPDGQFQLYEIKRGGPVPWMFRLKFIPHWVKVTVAIAASMLLSFLFTRTLIGPINSLRQGTNAIAEGKLDTRVNITSNRSDELGDLAKDFNSMAQRLEILVNSQRSLLGDISHELRSPLTRLSLACALAQDNADDKTNMQLARIEKEAQLLDSMIERILMLSRLENRQQTLRTETIPLTQLLTPVLNDAQFEAQSSDKQINLPTIGDDLTLDVDPQLIASAIENLLRNAIKYAHSTVDVSLAQQTNAITLLIRDDGPGVEESELKHITEPFYRVGSARTRQSGGTGLGLAIAAKAIAAHKGVLELQNHPQGGLVASIYLPTN
ncbi:ATP-binding protein [Pseudoalteromonas pernae]|uniref:ATP-binding protein n=1 Tax=Pseudoalteromonas pernae TaxID=3118054 RepID=UPI003242ABE5